MIKKEHIFGHELLLDCYGCKKGACGDLDHCYSFLDKLVDAINMRKQAPPQIFRTDHKLYPDKAGLSGWVPLVESSIVIHTLSKHNFISIDIYTCGKLDPKRAVALVKKYFGPQKIEKQYLKRGRHYYIH
ncbi:S-adenosylmethionine decarboxylase [Candidatus Woesearchaeota archaeon]|nr:S-adenosylmethionine decarboxylase [Candidatus Woesearchaeota archaeon]